MTMTAQLEADFGWHTTTAFTLSQLLILQQAAADLLEFTGEMLPGAGLPWMRRWLARVNFHIGGVPQQAATWFSSHKMSVVFPHRDIWLSPDFDQMVNPRQHLVHELAHVLDNLQANRTLPATVFGGGPADRLTREMGGQPRGLRFSNGISGIPPALQWMPYAGGGYGNHSSAEYFAEALAWSVYYPLYLPSQSILSWLKSDVFSR